MGAASHWYFYPWSGMSQVMDKWDLSAKPADGQGDTDTSITSAELASAAIRLMSRKEVTEGRFFMWLHFFDPHAQYMEHPGAPDFSERGKSGAKALYDGEVWFADKHIGRVLDAIASKPWGDRTAIIVTADHGEAFGDHGMNMHGYELWESLVHVPLLVYVPGLEPHHVAVKRGHIDVAPTILDIMKVDAPEPGELRGRSLVPDLLAGEGDALEERDVYFDMPPGPFNAMRRGLLHGASPGKKLIALGGGQYQLFDLASDPGEKDDLAQDKEALAPLLDAFQLLRAGLKENDVKPVSVEPQ
jgi:arylsulfatase A-like enzyme